MTDELKRESERVKVAVYDNPSTMAREAWQNGALVGHVTADLMAACGFRESGRMPWWLNVGEWKDGQIVGDPEAIDAAMERQS